MTNKPQPPAPEKVQQTVKRLREICAMFDAQIMVLDELIAQVEAENRDNLFNRFRRNRGQRLLEALKKEKSEVN